MEVEAGVIVVELTVEVTKVDVVVVEGV